MSENTTPKNNSEDADLGQLFKLIGNAFNRFFNFLATIFKGLFNLLLVFLLFLQKHFVKFVITGVLGLGLGFYLDYKEGELYQSSMVVEPNFNSVQQLYNNINFYNELADDKDSTALSGALGISIKEAATIKEVYVESYSDENQKIKLFDDFIRQLDTNTIKTIDYKSYLKNFNSFNARFHKITFISNNSNVAKKTQNKIVSSISSNDYFELQKRVSDINIQLKDSIYNRQSEEIDSLQSLYRKVLLETAKNANTSTNINLADKEGSNDKELQLILQIDILKKNLVSLNEERANKAEIINVISDFPTRGVKIKKIWQDYRVLSFIGFIIITLLILLLLELNKFLKSYKASKE